MPKRLGLAVLTVAAVLGGASSIRGQAPAASLAVSNESADLDGSASAALERLLDAQKRGERVWIEQGELDPLIREGGGGACPSAAAIVAYQAMRLLAGLDADPDPHRAVLGAFASDPSLLHGRLTNPQLVRLLRFYEGRLEGAKIEVAVATAPGSLHATEGDAWDADDVPDLTLRPEAIKILSYTVHRDNGEASGRHFVVLRSCDGPQIQVIDPTASTGDRRYRLAYNAGGPRSVFLRYPSDVEPRPVTLELNTVFEISVKPVVATGRYTPTESSPVARMEREIDTLAQKLSARGELRSPRRWRTEGAKFGLPALDLPAEFGGAGWPSTKMLEVFLHAGRFDLNLRDVVGAAHGRVLLRSKAPEVRDIVQQVADGQAYVAIAITEPGSGSDFTAMQSRCVKVDGGYRLNGEKRFNARLDQATHVVVFTASNTGKPGRMNAFVLPIDAAGLVVERFGAHGLTGNSYGGLVMNDVFVPEWRLLGEEEEGYVIFNEHFRYWRLMQTAAAMGTAERALEQMAERLKSRQAFGGPIGRFTHLQQPLGQHATELKMAHSLARRAAELLDRGDYQQADILICGLKAEGVEIALRATDAAARAFGGEGYSDRVDIGDRLRDLQGLRIADGTTDVMRSAVVAKTYGREFWEMAIEPSK